LGVAKLNVGGGASEMKFKVGDEVLAKIVVMAEQGR
jgi:hypothetical protein